MKKNVGGLDRNARMALGPLLLLASMVSLRGTSDRSPVLAALAFVVGGVLTLTGVTRTCPANSALGRNTYGGTELSEEARTVREQTRQQRG